MCSNAAEINDKNNFKNVLCRLFNALLEPVACVEYSQVSVISQLREHLQSVKYCI